MQTSSLTNKLNSNTNNTISTTTKMNFKKNNESTIATTEYGETFPSALCSGNILGTQFHPEKSQKVGLQILKSTINFLIKDK